MKTIRLIAAACCAAFPSLVFASCGAGFCAVNTNWSTESALVGAGSSFDLRYEYINQNQPRSGTDNISVGQISGHHDEVQTVNHNLLATFSHTFNSGWGLSVVAPLVDRSHTHVHNHQGTPLSQQWNFTEPGDVRVTGRYQLPLVGDPLNPSTAGLIFGVKLPTGRSDIANAAGQLAERSLQPGSGTTDAIVGAYFHKNLPANNTSWFAQLQYQRPLNQRDAYKPGAQLGADVGVRYGVSETWAALLQVNVIGKGRDSGAQAEPANSGSRSVFLSPGMAFSVTDKLQIYAYFQQPLYQNVNGVQLTMPRAFTAGVTGSF